MRTRWPWWFLVALMGMAGAVLAVPAAAAPAHGSPAAPAAVPPAAPLSQAAFLDVWARVDWPVELGLTARGWTWGPQPLDVRSEPYAEGVNGQRAVEYWDKARMEINNPNGNPADPWYVTNGLLVYEMIAGQIQMGNHSFQAHGANQADVVAGDNRAANADAPSYAAMRGVTSISGDNGFPDRSGQPLTGYIDYRGVVGRSDTLLGYGVRYSRYVPQTQHNIPDRFWTYLQQGGQIYQAGRLVSATPLYDWVYLTGYPISEGYWVTARIGGRQYAVLVQLFQRRVLTYIPAFAPEWQVQMGNAGQHYHTWRYGR